MILIQSSPLFSGHFCMACLKISCLWLSTWAISYLMLCIHYVLNGHGRRANVSLHQIQHFHFYIDLQHYILIFTGKWVTNNLVNMKFFIWNAIPPPPRESLVQLLFFFSSFPFKCTVEKLGCLGAQIGLSLETLMDAGTFPLSPSRPDVVPHTSHILSFHGWNAEEVCGHGRLAYCFVKWRSETWLPWPLGTSWKRSINSVTRSLS